MTKSIVHGLLTFAASTSVLLAQGGGWSAAPGKGLSYDGGDAFTFKLANQLQTHYTFSAMDNGAADTSTFNIRRARTTFSGTAFSKDIAYKLQVDGVDTGAGIKEGHVQWTFMRNDSGSIGLRMGQGKTLFGLEAAGSSAGLMFVERSLAATTFSDAYTRGAWIMGSHNNNALRWSFGAMNTTVSKDGGGLFTLSPDEAGEETANTDNELNYVAAVNFDPMGDFTGGGGNEGFRQGDFREGDRPFVGTVGAAIAVENGQTGGQDLEGTCFTINTAWSVQGFQIMGEFFGRHDEIADTTTEADGTGYAVSGTWVMPKGADSSMQWAFGARLAYVEPDDSVDMDITEFTLGADAFYHGHACKSQLDYTMQDIGGAGDATNHIIRFGFQLLF